MGATAPASNSYLAEGYTFTPCANLDYMTEEIWLGKGYDEVYMVHYTLQDIWCHGSYRVLSGAAVPTSYGFDGNLTSAYATATIPLTDEVTGEPAGELLVDVVWTATGPPTRITDAQSTKLPGYQWKWHFTKTERTATVTGTFPTQEGSISRLHNVEHEVGTQPVSG